MMHACVLLRVRVASMHICSYSGMQINPGVPTIEEDMLKVRR